MGKYYPTVLKKLRTRRYSSFSTSASSGSSARIAYLSIQIFLNRIQADAFRRQLDYRATETGLHTGLGDEWLRLGGLKIAIDGGTSLHSAYMYEPFEGESEVCDYNRLNPEQLRRYFRTAQEHGWDVGIHTCGDRAMDMVVEAFADVIETCPNPDARHNVIHAYFPSDRALDLMAEHNIGKGLDDLSLSRERHDLPRCGSGADRQLGHPQHGFGQPLPGSLRLGHTAQQRGQPGRSRPSH